jgi:hypothetical protein
MLLPQSCDSQKKNAEQGKQSLSPQRHFLPSLINWLSST